jgi:hypothetical protein
MAWPAAHLLVGGRGRPGAPICSYRWQASLLLVLLSAHAHGELYKCVENGRTTYQDKPCAASSKTETLKIGPEKSSLIGCYEIDFGSFDAGAPHSVERWRVAMQADDDYAVDSLTTKGNATIHLRPATAGEIKEIGTAFSLRVSDGLIVKMPKDTPNWRPIGLYRVVEASGARRILAYFFLANGFAKPITCP